MKRSVFVCILISLCVIASAQSSLNGSWTQRQSMFGIEGSVLLSFDGDDNGTATETATLSCNMSFLGSKCTGEIVFNHKGRFEYQDGVLTIQWDAESFKYEITKPFVGTMNGHPDAEMQAQADEMLNDALEEFKSSAAETDVYNPVVIKKNKLIITSRSKDGKKEKETYVRAQ